MKILLLYGLATAMLSSLAAWKNRNPLAWGLIGRFPTSSICFDQRSVAAAEVPSLWRVGEENQA